MKNRPCVTLSPEVALTLQTLVKQPSVSESVRTCGEILLYINGGRMPAPAVSRTLKLPTAVVHHVCERFVKGGLKLALESNLDGSNLSATAADEPQRQNPIGKRRRSPKRANPASQSPHDSAGSEAKIHRPAPYEVKLDPMQQKQLQQLTYQSELPQSVIDQLEVLLLANAGCEDEQIAQRLRIDLLMVLNTRQRFAEGGIQSLLPPALLKQLQVRS